MHVEKSEVWRRVVGARLGAFREARKKSQAEFARLMDISPQRWNNYETGRRPVEISFAIELCRYGLTLDYLYRGEMAGLPMDLATILKPLDQEIVRQINEMH